MRSCTKCLETKPESEFYTNRRRRDRLCVWCKVCTRAHVGRRAETPRIYVTWLIQRAKTRSRREGLPFDEDLAADDVGVPQTCPLLGNPLDYSAPVSLHRPYNLPTLDRVVPELGYVRGNVWIVSWRANKLKSNGTLDEFKRMVANWPDYGKLEV